MAGILDSKTRFIDLIVTSEGKRQLASGDLRAEYASFTDMHTFYDKALGAKDASGRIFFEVMDRPENVIVVEKDDSGRLIEMNFSTTSSIVGDNIFTTNYSENVPSLLATSGSQFASVSSDFISASINHFNKNYLIGTKQGLKGQEFKLDSNSAVFTISNSIPFSAGPKQKIINVNRADPFLLDEKLSHLPNCQFLPPVNQDGSAYGSYSDLRNTSKQNWADIKNELGATAFSNLEIKIEDDPNVRVDMSGDFNVYNRESLTPVETALPKEFKTFTFQNTSDFNNIFFQIYETNSGSVNSNVQPGQNSIKKLDLVDAGVFYDESDPNGKFEKRVVYAGKVFYDDYDTPTFINMFTIVMD